ncbi:MAG: hypothetical protein HY558_04755 [Euryarchaeota archaeon]|nr:hypothetical protein [Euryarchaeota archaeon]
MAVSDVVPGAEIRRRMARVAARPRFFYHLSLVTSVGVGASALLITPENALFLLNAIFQALAAVLALLFAGFIFLKQRLLDFEDKLEEFFEEDRASAVAYLNLLQTEGLLAGEEPGRMVALVEQASSRKEKVEAISTLVEQLPSRRIFGALRDYVAQRLQGTQCDLSYAPHEAMVAWNVDNERFRIRAGLQGSRLVRESPTYSLESPPVSRRLKPQMEKALQLADLSFRFDRSLHRLPLREYLLLRSATTQQFSIGLFLILCFTLAMVTSLVELSLLHLGGPALQGAIGLTVGLTSLGICLLSYLLLLILKS